MTRKNSRGFTIIEIAIVVTIGGVLMASFSSALLSYLNQAQIDTTRQRIETIQQAIEDYLGVNGNLPCPAATTIGIDQPNFGAEADNPAGVECDDPAIAGLINQGSAAIKLGSVPVRDLNLSDEYMIDAWGARFSYVVTASQASAGGFVGGAGAINVIDSNGNPVSANADYVVISHGMDNAGAVNLQQPAPALPAPNIAQACNVGSPGPPVVPASLDSENCDNDATFLRTSISSAASGANRFDDYVLINSVNLGTAEAIPSGAVMAFDLAACPAGWSALANSAGRVIIGQGVYNQIENNHNDGTVSWNPGAITYANTNDLTANSANFGNFNGSAFYGLAQGELPQHGHNIPPIALSQAGPPYAVTVAAGNGSGAGSMSLGNSTNVGNDEAFPILPPFIVMRYCRKN